MADVLTPEQRSYCMSRIRSKDTTIEVTIRSLLHRAGLQFRKHDPSLPGRPDISFRGEWLAVFIDGDFWHGYRFPAWRDKPAPKRQQKIAGNRRRDRRTFQALRRRGWVVISLWEHEVLSDPCACVERVAARVTSRRSEFGI